MIAAVFLAMPYAYRQGANIRVTFLVGRLGPNARLVVDHVVQIVSLLYCAALVFATFQQTRHVLTTGHDVRDDRCPALAGAPDRLRRPAPHHAHASARSRRGAARGARASSGTASRWSTCRSWSWWARCSSASRSPSRWRRRASWASTCSAATATVVLRILGTTPFGATAEYVLTTIPMFILMAYFSASGGLARDLYTAGANWLSRVKGGLAIATVFACGIFGAMSGASLAAAAVMSSIAMPEMRRHGYSDELAAGVDRDRRDARHPHPAERRHGDLRHHHPDLDRQAAHRRGRARDHRGDVPGHRDPRLGAGPPGPRPARRTWSRGPSAGRASDASGRACS